MFRVGFIIFSKIAFFRPPIKIAFVVLLDLSKAFDSLDLSRLLAKLKTLRVGCTALELFGSYLSGRQQYVRIGAEASCLVAIYNGVPQGSILGPGLFTIFINDPSTDPEFGSLESYVDDSKLCLSFFCQRYLQCGPAN